jgi:hypothetical protein
MTTHQYSYPTVIELRRVVSHPSPQALAIDPRLRRGPTAPIRLAAGTTRREPDGRASR